MEDKEEWKIVHNGKEYYVRVIKAKIDNVELKAAFFGIDTNEEMFAFHTYLRSKYCTVRLILKAMGEWGKRQNGRLDSFAKEFESEFNPFAEVRDTLSNDYPKEDWDWTVDPIFYTAGRYVTTDILVNGELCEKKQEYEKATYKYEKLIEYLEDSIKNNYSHYPKDDARRIKELTTKIERLKTS